MDNEHGDYRMQSKLRHIEDDPHDAPIAPDVVPAAWAVRGPPGPATDAKSRERLFEEIRHAAETAVPEVDTTFRATDVNDIPALKNRPARTWIKRAFTVFVLALISAIAANAWKHHGNAAMQVAAGFMPQSTPSAEPAEAPAATEPSADAVAPPAADQPAAPAQPVQTASTVALPPETEQQIQSMARDLAAMGQQVEQLKAAIEQLKASQHAAVAPAPPVARPPAPKPQPKHTALPKPPATAASPPRPAPAYPVQASAVPPPPAPAPAAAPYYPPPPPQATTQPNGEPVVRPPMPMPLYPER